MTSAVILTSAIQEAVDYKVSFPQNFKLVSMFFTFRSTIYQLTGAEGSEVSL